MLYAMLAFSILAGIDKLLNNKFGLGVKFDEGFKAMGGLALTIIGIYSLSPIIASAATPILLPLANLLHTDPSVFIGSILATDLGAYNTSLEIARSENMVAFNGVILASTLGATISFTVPVATNLISVRDFEYFAKGILAGIVTVPVGMVIAGFMLKISAVEVILNLLPVIVFSALIAYGLIRFQDKMVSVFSMVGKLVLGLSTFGLLLSIYSYSTGHVIVEGMLPLEEAVMLVFTIAVVLSGAYPMLYFLQRRLSRVLKRASTRFGLDEYSILGLFSSLASCLPMMGVYHEMNWKGKMLNAAFSVSGAFVLGGQLGYVSSVSPSSVNAFIVSKLIAGISGMAVAGLLIKQESNKGGVRQHDN